jgi:hypothetical protein
MATIKNLVLEQGATFSANIQYLNNNKVPISLVGYNVRSKMRTSYNAANAAAFVAVITNGATGNINLSLTAANTAALEYGRYVYDVEAYIGQELLRVVEGTVDVTPGVSGMDLGSLLSGNVSTTDLIEGNNLYYTNARVQSALLNISGNILPSVSNTYNLGSPTQRWKSLFLEDKTIFLGNVAISLDDLTNKLTFIDTSNAAATISLQIGTGANSVTLNAQDGSLATSLSPNSVTSIMIAPGAITPDKIGGFNTANVAEFTNLYFTNARAIAAFTAGTNITIDVNGVISSSGGGGGLGSVTQANLTTSNVSEVTNLYFTNARAIAAFTAGSNISISANGIISSSGGGGGTGTVTGANLTTSNVVELGSNLYYSNTRVYSNVITILFDYATVANLNLKANLTQLTTANVAEVTNLYFTNTRVHANISPLLTTANVAEVTNLYFTNTRVHANISPLLTTANVAEVTNLYYTNARARSAFSAGSNISIDVNGVISSLGGGAGGGPGTVTQANLTTSNVVELGSNLYYSNTRVYSNVITILSSYATVSNLNLRANIADLTTANVAELSNNLYYTNARVYANVITLLNAKANVVDLTTANVIESANNLYYTNARVYSNVITVLSSYATVSNLNLRANIADLTTANVSEITNLYYTNVRVYSNVVGLLTSYATVANLNLKANLTQLTTANITEVNNLYYTNTRVHANVIGLLNTKANVIDLTTANVTESTSNLYYTNTRVYGNVIALLPTYAGNVLAGNIITGSGAGGSITGANLISTNVISATTWIGISTANVIEIGSNIYYTNTRVYSNVIGILSNYATVANLNLKANIVDLTTSNISEVTNLYYTNTRVAANVTALLPTYTGNVGAANVTVGTGLGGAIVGANLISANNFVADTITANTFTLSYRPAFRVWGSTTANVIAGTTLDSGNVTLDYNQNSSYATATGIFTAPITGLYQIYFNSCIGAANGSSIVQVLKNNVTTTGNVLCYWESDTNNQGGQNFGVSTVARLTANDNVRAKVLLGSIKFDANANWGVAFIG